jgi:glucans biosynthesis protein
MRVPILLLLLSVLVSGLEAQDESGFFAAKARDMAAKPYADGTIPETEYAKSLGYDAINNIRLKPGREIFAHGPGLAKIVPQPAGSVNSKGIHLGVLESGSLKPVPAEMDMFDYDKGAPRPRTPEDFPGFNGFFGRGPAKNHEELFEQFTFRGAAYFRSHAISGGYGLSARGLAVWAPDGKEEFPVFEQFAFDPQPPGSTKSSVHALMNSRSVTGSYHFTITPGEPTIFEVHAVVYPRRDDVTLGIAPFSSMLWFAPNSLPKPQDYRPRVHDSEALAVAHRSGERIWRVLDVSHQLRKTSFPVKDLAGFGLIQRERRFESYQDLTAAYHLRTSAWIEPIGDWGSGQVTLHEFPTNSEFDDNIVASWVPNEKPRTLQPIRVAYRILWCASEPAADGLARVTGTFRGHPPRNEKDELLVVNFEGAPGTPPELDLKYGPGVELIDSHVDPLPDAAGWQAHLGVRPQPGHPPNMELSLALQRDGKRISESWKYLWTPENEHP